MFAKQRCIGPIVFISVLLYYYYSAAMGVYCSKHNNKVKCLA